MLKGEKVCYQYNQESFIFDFTISDGSVVALMGPSGAGKSTLLALIAGFIEPISGDITINGHSLLSKSPHQRPFAMLFQEHNLFSHLTVRENIGLGLHPGLKLDADQNAQVVEAARQVGIEAYLDRTPEQLSGGQKQRVALARCFVQQHSVWLLDEPFSALDPILRDEMLMLVKQLVKERDITLLMVTHHVSDAKIIADEFLFIDKGQVLAHDSILALNSSNPNESIASFARLAEYR